MHPVTKLPGPQGLLRDSKKEERRFHLSSAFPTSFCWLSVNALYQNWRETQLHMAVSHHLGHTALLVEAMYTCALQRDLTWISAYRVKLFTLRWHRCFLQCCL